MTPQQTTALLAIVGAITETVKAAGYLGAPGGIIYAALMTHGCTLNQFESLMGAMVRAGALVKRGECYFLP